MHIKQYFLFIIILIATGCTNQKMLDAEKALASNNLKNELSTYLKEHADNPVNWQPWNEEVLALAKEQNKPVIISIGYASCHWCHVMEEESFEDLKTAQFMNDNFINIKVDREERPDIDQIYLKALEHVTGNGGWPLNVLALPDGRPIWLGTYQTKTEWNETLKKGLATIKNNPKEAEKIANEIEQGIATQFVLSGNQKPKYRFDEVESAINRLRPFLDLEQGGFIGEQKFMLPVIQKLILRYAIDTKDEELMDYINLTLFKMSNSGIYDPINGGFSRYSVDAQWHVPHFEKMLYDNAQLISLYSDAYKATGDKHYKKTLEKTIDFVVKELTVEKGIYASSLAADSKNEQGKMEEGAYYTFTKKELEDALASDYENARIIYNLTEKDIWEQKFILHQNLPDIALAKRLSLSNDQLLLLKNSILTRLQALRAKKARPMLDSKSLLSWNSLMINAFLDAHEATKNNAYLIKAEEIAASIEVKFMKNEQLYHVYRNNKVTVEAMLEDYSYLIAGYLQLYENTGEQKYLVKAEQLTIQSLAKFENKESPLLYFTHNEANQTIMRNIQVQDGVLASSNSIMATNLTMLSHYMGNRELLERAQKMTLVVKDLAIENAGGYAQWIQNMYNYSRPFYEVAILGDQANRITQEIQQNYLPNTVVAWNKKASDSYLLKNRFVKNKTLVYVCLNNSCKLPVTSSQEVLELMN